jgi:hypothetical protein
MFLKIILVVHSYFADFKVCCTLFSKSFDIFLVLKKILESLKMLKVAITGDTTLLHETYIAKYIKVLLIAT